MASETRLRLSVLSSARASSGGPTAARTQPAARRPPDRADARRGRPGSLAWWWVTTTTSMSPLPRMTPGLAPGNRAERSRPPAGLADHDVAGVHPARELQDRVGDVLAQDVVEGAAQGLDQGALAQQGLGGAVGQAVPEADVQGQQLAAGPRVRDPGAAPDQRLALGPPGQGDDDPLPGGPGVGDVVVGAVASPAPRRPGRRPRAGPARAGRSGCRRGRSWSARRRSSRRCTRCRGPAGGAGPAGSCRPARSGRRQRTTSSGTVSCWRMPVIDSTTSFSDSRCWMFTVVITSMPASSRRLTSCQRLAFAGARDVGVGQLVDQGHLGPAGQHRGQVHLGERRPPVLDDLRGAPAPARRPSPRCAPGRGSPRSR